MNKYDRFSSLLPHSLPCFVAPVAVVAISTLLPGAAWADGKITFRVVDAKTRQPIPQAEIILERGETEIEDTRYETGDDGTVTTNDTNAGVRKFRVRFAKLGGFTYKPYEATVTLPDGQTIEVEVALEESALDTTIKERLRRIDVTNTSISTFRDRKFFEMFPVTGYNRYSVSRMLSSVPGIVSDSLFQVHPRGEQNAVTYVLDGFVLPNVNVGIGNAWLPGDLVESMRVRTGGHPAQSAGGGAVVDIKTLPARYASNNPTGNLLDWRIGGGAFNTSDIGVTLGRQGITRRNSRPIGTIISFSRTDTTNAIENPQPNGINNNRGTRTSLFGKFDLLARKNLSLSAIIGSTEGSNDVSNRLGLDNSYAGVGQGFGYGGFQNAGVLPNQAVAGQKQFHKDENNFSIVHLRNQFNPRTEGVASLGVTRSDQRIRFQRQVNHVTALPANSSVDFAPISLTRIEGYQMQIDFTTKPDDGNHTFKYGFLSQDHVTKEAYAFIPQSQAALDALLAFDPRMGQYLRPTLLDDGRQRIPFIGTGHAATTTAFYAQDNWRMNERMYLNFGMRSESVEQLQQFNLVNVDPAVVVPASERALRSRKTNKVLPRVNLSYELPKGRGFLGNDPMVLRVGYNQLMNVPGAMQGSFTFVPLAPQLTDQVDFSVERQMHRQVVRFNYYDKQTTNQIGFRQMVPGVQESGFMTVNLGNGSITGSEFSYELNPRNLDPIPGNLEDYRGIAGFLTLANSNAKVGGVTPLHQQDQTLSAGLGYRFTNASQLGVSLYHGSGLQSSQVQGKRQSLTQVNLRYSSWKKRPTGGNIGFEIGVENLLDGRNRINFIDTAVATSPNSNFAGTRFQQGRRITVSLLGRY